MTAPIVVFVEEPSMRIVIEALAKNLGIAPHVKVLEHHGKSDLERSVSRKIAGWRSPTPAKYIVSRDLDSSQRAMLKERLINLVPENARARTKVRIVVPELEAWYIGDTEALAASGLVDQTQARRIQAQAKFRDLCNLRNAKQEFQKIIGRPLGQIATAHMLGPLLEPTRNRCANFRAFASALTWAAEGLPL